MSRGPHRPRRRFGQHFLHDPGVVRRIVDAIAPQPADLMLEIGPGEGVLTRALLERVDRLDAIEIDRDLCAFLGREFPSDRLAVRCADALAVDLGEYPRKLRVVGNLPYNVSTPLLFHFARWADRLYDLHFMLQREVVERMVAKPSSPEYGRLSVMLQVRFRMQRLLRVAPGAFRPPPKVESAVVRLVPLAPEERPQVDIGRLGEVVTKAFSARRKTLRHALGLDVATLAQLGLEPRLRPENLTPADYVRVARLEMPQDGPRGDR